MPIRRFPSVELPEDLYDRLDRRRRLEGCSLEELTHVLLSEALAARVKAAPATLPQRLKWQAAPMKPRIDLEDGHALQEILDETSF